MHEISLVRQIFKTLETQFSQAELSQLTGVDLDVGLLANVEPALMQSAFQAVTCDHPHYKNTALSVNILPIIVKCDLCGDVAEVHNYSFKCSNGHPTNNVIQGKELLIARVHFDETPEPSP